MDRRYLLVSVVVGCMILGSVPCVFGWGSGHDVMNALAAEVLPAEIAELLGDEGRKELVHRSHVPDDFTKWDDYKEKKGVAIHPDDRALLDRYGLKHPYALHSSKGQGVNAVLVTQSMIARDPARMAFWMACLLHTMGDEAACNHDPLIHYITYAFTQGYKMTFGSKGVLDFGQIEKHADSMAAARRLLVGSLADPVEKDRTMGLVELMQYGYHANAYMTQRGARIARSHAVAATDAEIADAHQALTELAVYGITNALATFRQCRQAASEGILPEISDEMVAESARLSQEFVAERPLSNDSLYTELLERSASEGPSVGIVVEVSQSMNKGLLSFGGKLIMPAVARTLSGLNIPFLAIDLRELAASVPEVARFPVIAICSGGFHAGSARENLKKYREAGGRLFMIGGSHADCLGELSKALAPAPEMLLPVTRKYGCNNEEYIDRITIQFAGPFADVLGTEPYRFIHNPDTRAGWQKPVCASQVEAKKTSNLRILASVSLDDTSCAVAAALSAPDGGIEAVFVPEYLVAPYLLSDTPPFIDPSRPQLDAVGRALVKASMSMLAPELPGRLP